METLEKKNILQDVLTEHGYSGWYVIEPTKLIPANCFLVFNPKEKKISEVSIPDEWLDDPRRRSTIGELLASTIQTCGYILPRANLSSSITGAEHQSNALGEKDSNIEYRKTTAISAGWTNQIGVKRFKLMFLLMIGRYSHGIALRRERCGLISTEARQRKTGSRWQKVIVVAFWLNEMVASNQNLLKRLGQMN